MSRILIVDDDADHRLLLKALLEEEYEVLLATNGHEGVEKARQESPELIVMDLSMPVMNGWEAAREIKADSQTRQIPIIALTGHDQPQDRLGALESGCDAYISKPVDDRLLKRRIISLLSED